MKEKKYIRSKLDLSLDEEESDNFLSEMDFDAVLEELGELGRFQVIMYLLVCFPVLFAAANSLSYVFTAGVIDYRCFIPECENPDDTTYNVSWIEWAIPKNADNDQVIGFKSDLCDRYAINRTAWSANNDTCQEQFFDRGRIEKCTEWIFSEAESTIVNEWNLTCTENQWKISLVGSSHFAGIIAGSLIFGILADRFGRKIIFIFCILLMTISGVFQAFSPEYVTFVVLTFVNALGTAGVYPLAFILGVEMVGKNKREITGIVLNYFYAVGEALVALFAWIAQDWQELQLIVSAPSIVFVVYYWIIPESVRWLMANSENQKAKSIVLKAAKINRVELSENLISTFESGSINNDSKNTKSDNKILPIVKVMLKSKTLIIRFSIMYFIWGVNAFVYYGLSINATTLSGNKYINFALVSLIEIPGYTIAWICIQKLGRKPSLIMSLLLCGITCTLTIFAAKGANWIVITLFLLGKMAITSAFGVVYVHTAEMLPTIIRSGGVGIASTIARVGALLAPFVPLLGVYFKPLPMIMFGGLAIIAGLLAFKLPETYGKKLPETVLEAKKL